MASLSDIEGNDFEHSDTENDSSPASDNPEETDSSDTDEIVEDGPAASKHTDGSYAEELHTDTDTYAALQAVLDLRNKLLENYEPSPQPPTVHYESPTLTKSQHVSLRHYAIWSKTGGTHDAYNKYAELLEDELHIPILSKYKVEKLAAGLVDFKPSHADMCPNSCIAYTGDYENLDSCPFKRDKAKVICGEPRWVKQSGRKAQQKARAQVTCLPVAATIKALFANAETSQLLRHRDTCLKQALHLAATASGQRTYSDFGDSQVHQMHYQNLKLFQDPRDIAFALSTDGAQLTMKKHSNTWILILILLNLPPDIRYKAKNIIILMAIPGPNSPGDIESFMILVFQQLAKASAGIWIWDAVDSSYFMNHAHLCMVLGDMLGSAKLSGMAGHSANYGDRFSNVKGARASLEKRTKAQYYPISPPENDKYNPDRPRSYDLNNLPMRTEDQYWAIILKLNQAKSKKTRDEIVRTGISRLPLSATSLAFVHPTFFPSDPFHLFYENCMSFFWDMWITSPSTDVIHLSKEKASRFGQLVANAMFTLPPSFCGPIRNPFLKRHSQYKIYEWMALLHWYVIPIGIELGFSSVVLQNFSHFAEAIEFAMTIKPRNDTEIVQLHQLITKFLIGYEKLYVGNNPANIARARLCIFQLIHVPRHIVWNGSVKLGSQATVERSIGELGHKIRSKKSVFANLDNLIYRRELLRILFLYYPSLDTGKSRPSSTAIKMIKQIRIKKNDPVGYSFSEHLKAISTFLNRNLKLENVTSEVLRWGKIRLPNGVVIHSHLSDLDRSLSPSIRYSRWFEVYKYLKLNIFKCSLYIFLGCCASF